MIRRIPTILATLALACLIGATGCDGTSSNPGDDPTCYGMPACPAGTERVSTCPEDANCTRVEGDCATVTCKVLGDGGTTDTGLADTNSTDADTGE